MIKNYKFNYDNDKAIVRFIVDTEKFTEEHAKETLDFFTLDYDEDNDIIDEVMKYYAFEVIKLSSNDIFNRNVKHVINEFKGLEGYCNIDGSRGIELVEITPHNFDIYLLEVEIN